MLEVCEYVNLKTEKLELLALPIDAKILGEGGMKKVKMQVPCITPVKLYIACITLSYLLTVTTYETFLPNRM